MSDGSPTPPLPFGELVVLDDFVPHPAALNMAVDEVLLDGLGSAAVLRCYRWSREAVSFGCFGKSAAVRADHPGAERVRRWTGGGIVEHGRDFTYTLLVPRAWPLAALPASECYRLIHGAVASALAAVGWQEIESASPARAPGDADAAPFLKPCFANPVAHDLLVSNRKVAGGAQRRTRRGLLHQGSIQGAAHDDLSWGSRWRDLRDSLAAALARKTGHAHCPVSAATLEAAHRLASSKYGNDAWTQRF